MFVTGWVRINRQQNLDGIWSTFFGHGSIKKKKLRQIQTTVSPTRVTEQNGSDQVKDEGQSAKETTTLLNFQT